MTDKPQNTEVDDFILANIPATFWQLSAAAERSFGCDVFRQVDGRLQNLRKRGVISFERVKGAGVVWNKCEETGK